MRERKTGCIINMASRSATVDTPLGLGYNDAKAAVVRATSNIQLELDRDGFGDQIHTYALHPGGVLTAMGAGKSSRALSIPNRAEPCTDTFWKK